MTSHEREHDQPEVDNSHKTDQDEKSHEQRMYLRFGLMITTSTAVMFALTYTNAFAYDHVRWSEERFYMALLMGGAMALVMLAFMRSMMYKNGTLNITVVVTALVLGGTALYLSDGASLNRTDAPLLTRWWPVLLQHVRSTSSRTTPHDAFSP